MAPRAFVVFGIPVLVGALALIGILVLAGCVSHTPAEPAPAPQTAASATPIPSPTPVSARTMCGVGPGTGDGLQEHCPRTSPSFLPDVDAAINRVVDRHPELFDLDDH